METQRDHIADVRKIIADGNVPEIAGELDRAVAAVATMPPDRIKRLQTLGVPLLLVAETETRTGLDLSTEWSDWTLYGVPAACCGSPAKAALIQRRVVEATCRDTEFRSVRGSVERSGRETRPVPLSIVGIIPFGVDAYRGMLVSEAGERLSVVWKRRWQGDPGDRSANDPLDGRPHTFQLRHLAGAKHWTAINWSGRRDGNPDTTYSDRRECVAELTRLGT